MNRAIGPMLGVLVFAVACGQPGVPFDDGVDGLGGEAGSGGAASGGAGGVPVAGGGSGGGGGEPAVVEPLVWSWESREVSIGARDVACDDDGRCVGLVVGLDDIQLVDLESGEAAQWSKDPAMDGDLRFGRVEWIDDRFLVVGGVGYTGVVLEETDGGLELVFRSDTADVCVVVDAFACSISSPFASVVMAGDELFVLHPDGKLLRGSARARDWALLPSASGVLFFSALAGTPEGQLFGAGFGGLYQFDGTEWTQVADTLGLDSMWSDGNGFFAGAGFDGSLVAGAAGDLGAITMAGTVFTDVWGASREAVLAVGSGGRIVQFDGSAWQDLALPEAEGHDLVAVSGNGSGAVVILAADGLVLRGEPAGR